MLIKEIRNGNHCAFQSIPDDHQDNAHLRYASRQAFRVHVPLFFFCSQALSAPEFGEKQVDQVDMKDMSGRVNSSAHISATL